MKGSHHKRFSPDEDEFIRECVTKGLGASYCANRLGRANNSILARANRLKLSFATIAHHGNKQYYYRKYG